MRQHYLICHLLCFLLPLSVWAKYEQCQFPPEVESSLLLIDNKGWTKDGVKSKTNILALLENYEAEAEGITDTCRAILLHRMALIVDVKDQKRKLKFYKKAYWYYNKEKNFYDSFSIKLLNNIAGRFNELGGFYRRDSFPIYIRKCMNAELERKRQGLAYSDQYPRTCHWFGRYLRDIGNSQKALVYYKESVETYPIYRDKRQASIRMAEVYNDMSILLSTNLKMPDEGIKNAENGLSLLDENSKGLIVDKLNFNLASAFDLLASSLEGENKLNYYELSHKKYNEVLSRSKSSFLKRQTLNNMGLVLNKMERYEEALDTLKIITQLNEKDGYLDLLAKNFDNQGDSYTGLGEYDLALAAYTQAMDYTFFGYESADLFSLPELEFHRALNEIDALKTLKSKSEVFFELSKELGKDNGELYLQAALAHYQFIDQLLDRIRQEFLDESAQFMLAAEVKGIYESAIKTCLLAAERSQNDEQAYKELAWYYAERSKGISLLEWVNMRQAAQIFLSEDEATELFDRIYKRNSTQGDLDIAMIDKDSAQINTSRSKLARYNTLLIEYQASLKEKYPNYQKFLERSYEPPSIAKLYQGILDKGVTVIEYFLGKEQNYAFVVEQNQIRVVSLEKQDLFEQILSIRTSLARHREEGDLSALDAYIQNATSLYDVLIRPIGEIKEEVMIIPDEYLLYFPFEILLTGQPIEKNNLTNYPYWIKDKIISYNYSIMLFQEMVEERERRKPIKLWGSFAPEFPPQSFPNNKDGSLLYSAKSAIATAQKFGGRVFYKDTANIDNFNRYASDYQYLQLATHSLINEQDSNIVQFRLWDGSISMQELYTKHLNADMVILNVCRTNFGKLYKGAGMASLNRGFVSAGVGSILSTLWQVEDQYTSPFMAYFIAGISDPNTSGNDALRTTKLRLIEDPRYNDPFLWGSYIIYGDVYLKRDLDKINFWWTLLPLLLIGLILGRVLINRYR